MESQYTPSEIVEILLGDLSYNGSHCKWIQFMVHPQSWSNN